jgi:hypothetical protein
MYFHVGAPKTGTTYLQSRLFRNRASLRAHAVDYPAGRWHDPRNHYFAALELTETDHAVPRRHVDGAWERLLRQARRASGDVLVSHEVFAKATRSQAERALSDLASTGAETHVVVTARDLSRQLTSGWQEALKFGSTLTFAAFVERARKDQHPLARSFDPTRTFDTWGADLPADRLHVVTAPPPQADRSLLWRRFLEAVRVDPTWAPLDTQQDNSSVGVPQAQLLRRLNRRLGDATRRGGAYVELVNGPVLADALVPRDSPRITVGPDDYPWVCERSEAWIDWLRRRGVVVHGDLDDLRPTVPADDWVDPDGARPAQLASAALDVVETLLSETARRRQTGERWRAALARLRR